MRLLMASAKVMNAESPILFQHDALVTMLIGDSAKVRSGNHAAINLEVTPVLLPAADLAGDIRSGHFIRPIVVDRHIDHATLIIQARTSNQKYRHGALQ
jgi:hypothetical protein